MADKHISEVFCASLGETVHPANQNESLEKHACFVNIVLISPAAKQAATVPSNESAWCLN